MPRTKRLTALVVDGNRDTREMYTHYLSSRGLNTVEAEDGVHALAKAKSIQPDVISTNSSLPRLNGMDLCRTLQQQEQTRTIPVIVLGDGDGEFEAARQAGCVSVLPKPCSPDDLLEEIRRVLATR